MPIALSAERRAIHSARGYTHTDGQYTLKATPAATITSFKAGRTFKRTAATTYLEAYVDDNGTNSRLRIDTIIAGTRANLATTNLGSRVASGTAFWVRGRIEGNVVTAEYFTSEPYPNLAATSTVTATLTGSNATTFGQAVAGQAGWSWIPQHASATLDDYRDEPYTYSLGASPTVAAHDLTLYGIPGTAPAAVSMESATTATTGGIIVGWGVKSVENYIWNGHFESVGLAATGWSVAGLTNFNNAATSISRVTTAAAVKYGAAAGELVVPATAGAGTNFVTYRRFRKGVTYTATAWVRQSAGTANTVAVHLGNSAANDKAASSASTMTATHQQLSVTWTPSDDRDRASIALIATNATTGTYHIDGVMLYEGTTAPTATDRAHGQGAVAPFGLLEAENAAKQEATGTQMSLTADATGSLGQIMKRVAPASGESWFFYHRIDPSLLAADDFAATVTIEFWARYKQTSSAYDPTFQIRAYPLADGTGGTMAEITESDTGAKTVNAQHTAWALTRVGAITFPNDATSRAVWETQFRIGLPASGVTGDFSFDYLLAVPARQRIAGRAALAGTSSFPNALLVNCDLTTYRREYPGPSTARTQSPGGQRLEFPPGTVNVVHKLARDPLSDSAEGDGTVPAPTGQIVHFSIQPRYHITRAT